MGDMADRIHNTHRYRDHSAMDSDTIPVDTDVDGMVDNTHRHRDHSARDSDTMPVDTDVDSVVDKTVQHTYAYRDHSARDSDTLSVDTADEGMDAAGDREVDVDTAGAPYPWSYSSRHCSSPASAPKPQQKRVVEVRRVRETL